MHYSETEKQYHTQVGPEDIGRYVIMPGDPKRCAKIAKYLENPVLIADSREYVTYTGTLLGEKVSVTSTGIGGPSAAIAMEELVKAGADTFVRIGTCGGIQPEVKSGDVVIATAAVRMDGTSKEYAPLEFPAVADLTVTNALVASTLFVVGSFRHVRCGSCFLVMANQEREKLGLENPVVHDTDGAIRVAISAVRKLIEGDRRK